MMEWLDQLPPIDAIRLHLMQRESALIEELKVELNDNLLEIRGEAALLLESMSETIEELELQADEVNEEGR
jgi:hypothetical protein